MTEPVGGKKEIPSEIEEGLSFTEMYAYKGQVINVFRTLGLTYYTIWDSAEDQPYALSHAEFVEKFTYGHGDSSNKTWVRFLNEKYVFLDEENCKETAKEAH